MVAYVAFKVTIVSELPNRTAAFQRLGQYQRNEVVRGRSTEWRRPGIGKAKVLIPSDQDEAQVNVGGHELKLTNLRRVFWPEEGISKRDLLQYYADISPVLLPHLKDRAVVMKRYPNGASGDFFFQKRIPEPHPAWVKTCEILHASGNTIHFPMIQDLASLLWVVNLGCIDLNQWYATCDDIDRPDYLHFDLDPAEDATFGQVLEAALAVRSALLELKIPSFPKTSGSRGIHIYVPIRRGPIQKQVWGFAKEQAQNLASRFPKLITAEYSVAKRPAKHVLVDYNQNAWGRTLASVYSVRPKAGRCRFDPRGLG